MNLKPIAEIAKKLDIPEEAIEPYGKFKAKIDPAYLKDRPRRGHLILVTAITPTKAGEGKTTCSIALADGLNYLGCRTCLALREPSLGPVFGIKGGATGGGLVTVEPQEEINLHFTGDMHALTTANNLIAAIIDNHIFQGNELMIDPDRIVFPRAMDMNDRALRDIEVGRGKNNGQPRSDSFVITVASELMAILCLASDPHDFESRIKEIIVAYTFEGKPVKVSDLKISRAVMKLMREALKPNLVQTACYTPAFIHGGPFANIAHGCNSIIATDLALRSADYVVTEAGFASDLGAEKFLDIKCREADIQPDCIVLVATLRALKLHGGAENLQEENLVALQEGLKNLEIHAENMKSFGKPLVIAINHFLGDHDSEISMLKNWCQEHSYPVAFTDGFLRGAEGSVELAELVQRTIKESHPNPLVPTYEIADPIKEKILKVAKRIYRAKEVIYSDLAEKQLAEFSRLNIDDFYVCIAKTPLSLSDNPKLIGAPIGHSLHVRSIRLSNGARFIIPITGSVLTMPGLPKIPAAVKMEDEDAA